MANLFQPSLVRFVNSTNAIPGGKMLFYLTTTLTLAVIYSDGAGLVPMTNPVVADSAGIFPTVFLDPNITYRVRWTDAAGVVVRPDADPVPGTDPAVTSVVAAASAAATAAGAVQVSLAAQQVALATIAAATASSYPNTAASNVPRGLIGAGDYLGRPSSIGAITPGSGGTNGTFALAWSGGNFVSSGGANPTGTFTVAGGALTAVTITGSGLYIGASPTVPTPSFAASAGLGGGAAVALTAQFLIPSGSSYWVQSVDTFQMDRYINLSGVATAVASPPGPIYTTAGLNAQLSPPNGTMKRWLSLVTTAGSGASSTVQDALVTVEQMLYATGLISKIVRLNLRVGTSAAAARIPFVMRQGCGNLSETGTIASFTQASGLTGPALDTGFTMEKGGLGAYNLGLGAYVLSSPGGSPSAFMLRASDSSWGFSPLYASGVNFAFGLMSAYSAAPYNKPDVSYVAGGTYSAPVLGTMVYIRDKTGTGNGYRNGVYLPESVVPSISSTPLTQNLYVDTTTFASGGDWITEALTAGEVSQLHWIIHNFNVAIGRGVVAEGL